MRFALYKVEPIGWGRIFYVTTEQNLRPVKIESICRRNRIKCGSDGEICSLSEPITKKKRNAGSRNFPIVLIFSCTTDHSHSPL